MNYNLFAPTHLWLFGILHFISDVAGLGFGELHKQDLHSLLHKTLVDAANQQRLVGIGIDERATRESECKVSIFF